MTSMSTYKVTVQFPGDILALERRRAGIVVDRTYGYEGPLTDEQLESIKSDDYLTVEEVKPETPASTSKPATKK